ncbi:MAG: hypothetical protein CMQ29_07225 [Gammaproteobacteria bacterium]|nr:hypothetical protein [Gammaproteobacteria bacterium]
METQLDEVNATLIIASHKRCYLHTVATRFVLIANGYMTENDRTERRDIKTLAAGHRLQQK